MRTVYVRTQADADHLDMDRASAPGLAFLDRDDTVVVDPEIAITGRGIMASGYKTVMTLVK